MSNENIAAPETSREKYHYEGLSAAEVQERQKRGETNFFKADVSRSYAKIFQENVFNLFNIVLGTLLLIVIAMGDYSTAFFAGFSVVTNTFLGMLQEMNAKRKLENLATLSQQKVQVWRDGEIKVILMAEVVKDDIIKIEPGDRIVVDGNILVSDALELDESSLTGESDAILKLKDDEAFSGSFCVAGTGVMQAEKVGVKSRINQLSMVAKQYKRVLTPTQEKINAIVEVTVLIMFIFVPLMFIYAGLHHLSFQDAIRNAVVFVTSLVPQGLVLVAILSLTIGALKISRHETLIQKVNAVESLANATVLCFDKTGTLTQNKLAVQELELLSEAHGDDVDQLLYDYLEQLSHRNNTAEAVARYALEKVQDAPIHNKIKEIPFTSARKWGAMVFEEGIYALGAPEKLFYGQDQQLFDKALEYQQNGLRVLAFVRLLAEPQGTELEEKAEAIAIIILSDQLREGINETLQSFRDEGLALKVISGDNVETVKAIAAQAGLISEEAYTEKQLRDMDDAELESAVTKAHVFARIEPDTKKRIIKALQRQGHYVAMVGDGVNDVPALKEAQLAIVMNDGAQISKDVSDIVLLNNAMSTLPLAFREGKEITQTVYGTTKMFLVKNFYNIGLFVLVAFMAMPFPITPAQISWGTFGTVNLPATLVAFGLMRPQKMTRFRHDVLDYIFTCGLVGAVMMTALYAFVYLSSNRNTELARSVITIFVSLYGMNIVWDVQGIDISDAASFVRNKSIVLMTSVLTLLTIVALYALPNLFEFVDPMIMGIELVVLITATFLLSILVVSHGMRYRYLLERLWMLFDPKA
ncbi:cation-translocating P-type ATPase [Anaerolineales bacterium]